MTERLLVRIVCLFAFIAWLSALQAASEATNFHVGAAAVELEADDSMIIAGGITAAKRPDKKASCARRRSSWSSKPFGKLAIVACDVLMITRLHLDPVVAEIEKTTGIPAANILINCTHTHHAPSTMIVHGYGLDAPFTRTCGSAPS
jgi:hypothetical protein